MTAVYLRDAVRTPRGKAKDDGGLAALAPAELVAQLVGALERRGAVDRAAVDGVILGCVGQVGAQGGNIAMVSKLRAGVADRAFAFALNNYCVSGLSAIGQAAAMVGSGAAHTVVAGGVELMSRVPFLADGADFYRDRSLPPRARYLPVALAADRLAVREGIGAAAMDQVALRSQARAAAAESSAALQRSRIAVTDAAGGVALDRDECVRAGASPESLAALPPAFAGLAGPYADLLGELDHRHSIAHAPPMADGAGLAAVTADPAGARARVLAYAERGGDPEAALWAGFDAMDEALERAGLSLADLDCIELMEAFAVTIALFLRDREVDPDRVNVSGGHLAKGHPLGATGAILSSTLLDALDHAGGRLGLVVASGAHGVGAAMVVERL